MHTTLRLTGSILGRVSVLSLAGFAGFAGSATVIHAFDARIWDLDWTFCVFLMLSLGVQAHFDLVLRLPLSGNAAPPLAAGAPLNPRGHILGFSLFLALSGLAFGASLCVSLTFEQKATTLPPFWLGAGLWLYLLLAALGRFLVTSYLRATFEVSGWLSETMHHRVQVAIHLLPPFFLGFLVVWLGLWAEETLRDGALSLWLALPLFAALVVALSWAQAYATVVLCRAYAPLNQPPTPSSDAHTSR